VPARRFFASVPKIQPHTDPSLWPVSLTLNEVAVLTRQSAKHLYARVKHGTAQPMPTLQRGQLVKPYRWHRDTVRQFVEGTR
jgi:hypothetical protein